MRAKFLVVIIAGGIFLLLVIGGVFRFVLPPPLMASSFAGPGLYGPICLESKSPVILADLDRLILWSPVIAGHWESQDTRLCFRPERFLEPGKEYILTLKKGLRAQDGRRLWQDVVYPVHIRQPRLLYLGGVNAQKELWLANADGSGNFQVTHTNGAVLGFAPAHDGNSVITVQQNNQGGSDLWLLSLDDSQPRLLLACGPDDCGFPSWRPDGTGIVYSRTTGDSSFPELFSLNLSGSDRNTGRTGLLPLWSPDGKYLSYYDRSDTSIHITNEAFSEDWRLPVPVESSGIWLPDGHTLVYIGPVQDTATPFSTIFRADVTSRLVHPLFGEDFESLQYSLPKISPLSEEYLVAVQPLEGYISQQLVILDEKGEPVVSLTEDVLYTHGAYSWSPDGTKIAYQRLQLGSSHNKPEVLVWHRKDGQLIRLAEDAAWPTWIP